MKIKYRLQTDTASCTAYYAKPDAEKLVSLDPDEAQLFSTRDEAVVILEIMHNPEKWAIAEVRTFQPSLSGEGY